MILKHVKNIENNNKKLIIFPVLNKPYSDVYLLTTDQFAVQSFKFLEVGTH